MTATATPAPGFLAALLAVTRHDEFAVKISADDPGHLHVSIRIGEHEPLEATGPATALDRKLPEAIRQYAAWVEGQIVEDGPVKIDLPRGMSARAVPPKKAPTRAPKPKKVKARRKPAAKRAVRVAKPAPRRTPAARKSATANSQAGRAGKPECIADYKALKAKQGDKLTRRLFVDAAKTGRRYEKLWANNWPAFVKEAEGAKDTPPSTAAAPAKAATKSPAKTPAAKPKKESKKAAPKDDKRPWTIKAKGKTLGITIFDKKPGDPYTCSAGQFVVQSMDSEKREIYVEPAPKPAAPPSAPAGAAAAAPPTEAKKQIPYAIKSTDGTTLGAIVQPLAVGAKWGAFDRWEVVAIDDSKREYSVKDTKAPANATTKTEATIQETQ